MAEPGLFESFYASPIQHPGLLWLAAVLAAVFIASRRNLDPALRRFAFLLCGLSCLDAWLTSDRIPGIGSLPASLSSVVPLFFVLAGDLRYFLLVTGARSGGRMVFSTKSVAWAVCWTSIVPIASYVVMSLLPMQWDRPRVLFLVYELAFFALTLGLLRWSPRLGEVGWLRRFSRFVLLYYGLWAFSDAIILTTGWDFGFGLRVVPNVLYYGGFMIRLAVCAGEADSTGVKGFQPR